MARRYVTLREAADYLGMTVGALRQRVWRRTVPYIKRGRSIRFDLAALDRWMAEGKCDPLS